MTRRDGGIDLGRAPGGADARDGGEIVGLEGIARDITALKAKEADLRHQALHDPLTGLPNRVLLLDRARGGAGTHPLAGSGGLAVLYLDLDRFKTVNDNLGHELGDRLLAALVAPRLQDTLRPSDSVARLGGDEFAAILPDLRDPTEATQVAERLLDALGRAASTLDDGELVTTVSIGIAFTADGACQRRPSCSGAPTSRCTRPRTAGGRGSSRYDALERADRAATTAPG